MPSVSTDSFGIQAASVWKFYRSTMYESTSSCLLSTTKTSPHPSYGTAYFKVTLPCCLSHHAIKQHTQISLLLRHSYLQIPTVPCKAKLHISSRNSRFQPCVTQSFKATWFFLHFIPITLGGCLPSVSTYLICKLLFHFAFTKENKGSSNSTDRRSE